MCWFYDPSSLKHLQRDLKYVGKVYFSCDTKKNSLFHIKQMRGGKMPRKKRDVGKQPKWTVMRVTVSSLKTVWDGEHFSKKHTQCTAAHPLNGWLINRFGCIEMFLYLDYKRNPINMQYSVTPSYLYQMFGCQCPGNISSSSFSPVSRTWSTWSLYVLPMFAWRVTVSD